jgi:hypothetical protein
MSHQFDLEQQILSCWRITDDIKLVRENIEKLPADDVDTVDCALLGLQTIYEMQFEKLWECFEDMVEELHTLRKKNGA